jgi:hypothetical protein
MHATVPSASLSTGPTAVSIARAGAMDEKGEHFSEIARRGARAGTTLLPKNEKQQVSTVEICYFKRAARTPKLR